MSDDVSPLTDDTPAERKHPSCHCRCHVVRLSDGGVALSGNQVHTAEKCGFFSRLSIVWSADGKDWTVAIHWRDA